jgi:hypothetical protein
MKTDPVFPGNLRSWKKKGIDIFCTRNWERTLAPCLKSCRLI